MINTDNSPGAALRTGSHCAFRRGLDIEEHRLALYLYLPLNEKLSGSLVSAMNFQPQSDRCKQGAAGVCASVGTITLLDQRRLS